MNSPTTVAIVEAATDRILRACLDNDAEVDDVELTSLRGMKFWVDNVFAEEFIDFDTWRANDATTDALVDIVVRTTLILVTSAEVDAEEIRILRAADVIREEEP